MQNLLLNFFPAFATETDPEILALSAPLDFKQGIVRTGEGLLELNVSDGFYFLAAEDAHYVLGDL